MGPSSATLLTVSCTFLVLVAFNTVIVSGVQICPLGASGVELTCPVHCCESIQGTQKNYFCCGVSGESTMILQRSNPSSNSISSAEERSRTERFATTYQTSSLQIDYSLLMIGLIVSVILSIALSLLCCLLCNGCWLHRRRNPHMYETVNDSGFYPLCCGFGIPLGTVVFSTHPPQFQNDHNNGVYGGSTASYASSRNRVRFNEDGTPKGVLKNGEHYPVYPH